MQRVLVLEDEVLIAELLHDWLIEQGCKNVLLSSNVAQALSLIESNALDAAILDWTLGHENSAPVAQLLQRRGVPFVFATGRDSREIADGFAGVPTLPKPFEFDRLRATLARLVPR